PDRDVCRSVGFSEHVRFLRCLATTVPALPVPEALRLPRTVGHPLFRQPREIAPLRAPACRTATWCCGQKRLSETKAKLEASCHARHQASRPRTPEDGERPGFHRQHRRPRTCLGYLHRRRKG